MDNRQSGSRNYLSGAPLQRLEDEEEVLQGKTEDAPRRNETGLPDNLKAGVESLSGYSLDDVRVHYNSSKPATVQALAYTQGTDIHVAPGQEKHLPHEAWHVAQQMAGRVSPTTNINGMPVNDNAALEHEADVMGAKALQRKPMDASTRKIHGGTVAQRKPGDDATGSFIYAPQVGGPGFRIPFNYGMIFFSEYQGGEMRSAGFSGCFMMVFRFNRMRAIEVQSLFPRPIPNLKYGKTFVAHVSNDMKEAVHDAEYKGLITVVVIIRPHNTMTWEMMGRPEKLSTEERYRISDPSKRYPQPFAGVHNLTGGMELIANEGGQPYWRGTVYRQEKIPINDADDREHYHWANEALIVYGRDEMRMRTSASKAYIYARVFLDDNCPTPKRRDAYQRLLVIRNQEPMALAYAYVELVDIASEHEVWTLLTSLYRINKTIIGGIGRAGIAYDSAEAIINGSHGQRSSVDGGVMVSMAPHIETLREIRRTSPGDIRWAFVAAMLNGDIEIMQYLKEFYYRR